MIPRRTLRSVSQAGSCGYDPLAISSWKVPISSAYAVRRRDFLPRLTHRRLVAAQLHISASNAYPRNKDKSDPPEDRQGKQDTKQDATNKQDSKQKSPSEEPQSSTEGRPSHNVSDASSQQTKSSKDQSDDQRDPKSETSRASSSSSNASDKKQGASSGSSGSSGSSSSSSSSASSLVPRGSVPTVYPQVLALPITRRPLFPGFYKAVVIKNPDVCAAIQEAIQRGQPYVGAFLLKSEEEDTDVITSLDRVHRVGVFAQITGVYPAQTNSGSAKAEEGMTAVLYPYRRIEIEDLVLPDLNSEASKKNASKSSDVPSIEHEQQIVDEVGVRGSDQSHKPKSNATRNESPPSEEKVQEELDDELGATKDQTVPPSKQQADKTSGDVRDLQSNPGNDQVVDDVSLESQRPTDKDLVADDVRVKSKEEMPSHSAPYPTSFLHNYRVSLVNVKNLAMEPYEKKPNQYIRAVMAELITVFKDIANLNPLFRDQIANFSISQGAGNVFEEPEKLADFAAAVSSSEVDDLQGVLQSMNVEDRLQKALLVLKKELVAAQLQNKISKDVESRIQKRQREFYLSEQLKGIKKELGVESDGKDKLISQFQSKAKQLRMPTEVRRVFEEEIHKLQTLEPSASEFNVTRGYLEWLTSIPWGVHTSENFALEHAQTVLNDDHYGLSDVKDRILEFLAIGKLRGTVQGKILCLVGPPGVGKTSIGKSIARALERKFFRFSVGGLSDVAEIKGHRRTYVGAMPGKAIQALKKVGSENPLILIDEVDKVSRGHNGDPGSALLEMLDPEQNASFMDHYLDVPVDLSRVLFVCTANTLDTISQPLLDRMEVIEVASYTAEEKRYIARDYLAPQAKELSGLEHANVQLPESSIDFLIKKYVRESGVRGLRKILEKVYRKVAYEIVQKHGEEVFPEPPSEPQSKSESESKRKELLDNEESHSSPDARLGDVLESDSAQDPNSEASEAKVTTQVRRPMAVPSSVEVLLSEDRLEKYLGPAVYDQDRLYTHVMPAGVALGLGFLGNGSGSLLPVETALMPGKGRLQLTGKLGDVIKESASIALSWIKAHAHALQLTQDANDSVLEHRDVHVHLPEGSIGKEGPSAGVAFCLSLISLLSNRPLPTDLAMTGEVSLHGMVMPVGGLKEKLLAAHRAEIKKVIVPAANRPKIQADVPKTILDSLEVHYVNNIWDALHIGLGQGPWSEQAAAWARSPSPETPHASRSASE
ncbi:endopeptidase La [Malassezia yamatoensis]|uniref:Lon protease homolog, mitochondrial n=1 Tax=Malassezia yamatoensis TaxID=253288 RepID=A0AAJ5YWU6_9BASI|nr:endopeptidase La [Malassezia yamatoensis]